MYLSGFVRCVVVFLFFSETLSTQPLSFCGAGRVRSRLPLNVLATSTVRIVISIFFACISSRQRCPVGDNIAECALEYDGSEDIPPCFEFCLYSKTMFVSLSKLSLLSCVGSYLIPKTVPERSRPTGRVWGEGEISHKPRRPGVWCTLILRVLALIQHRIS